MNQDHEWLRIGFTNRTNLHMDAAFLESLLPPRYSLLGNAHLESKAFNRAISCNTSAAGIFQRVSVYQDKTTPAPHPSSATQKQTPTTSVEHQVKIEGHIQHGQTIIAHN